MSTFAVFQPAIQKRFSGPVFRDMLQVVFRENGRPEGLFGYLFYEGDFIVVRASSTTAISSTVSP